MLIPIIQDYYREGRIPVSRHRVLLPFFPNCNLSARRAVFDSVGDYDEELKAAEDSDICRRAALDDFTLFFEPQARVFHACRPDLPSLFRQWYSYGYWSAAVYKKHMENRCEIYSSLAPVPRINRFTRITALKYFPFPVLFFFTYFAWILLFGLGSLLMFLAGWTMFAGIGALVLTLYLIFFYTRHPILRSLRLGDKLIFSWISVLINISCLAGSLMGGIRNRMFYIFSGI